MDAVIDPDALDSVVARAASGDEVAFARLVAAHQDDMARVAYVICGDADLAQEATQLAWPKAWRKVGTIRDPGRIHAWLVSVAANEARQLTRSRGRRWVREVHVEPDDEAWSRTHAADPADRAAAIDLANAIAGLDLTDRAILALRYVAGFTSLEIGEVIGMTSGGVRARTQRLLARLRRELHE